MACLTGLSATKVPARSSRRAWLIALLNSACGNCFCTCSGSSDHAPKECDGNPRCGPRSARRLCSRSKSATLPCRRLRLIDGFVFPLPVVVPAAPAMGAAPIIGPIGRLLALLEPAVVVGDCGVPPLPIMLRPAPPPGVPELPIPRLPPPTPPMPPDESPRPPVVPSDEPAPPILPIPPMDFGMPPAPIPPVPRWVSLSDSCWLSFSPARPLINGLAPLSVVGVVPVVVCCAAVALSCSSAGVKAPWLPADGLVANTCDGCIPWVGLRLVPGAPDRPEVGVCMCAVGTAEACWVPTCCSASLVVPTASREPPVPIVLAWVMVCLPAMGATLVEFAPATERLPVWPASRSPAWPSMSMRVLNGGMAPVVCVLSTLAKAWRKACSAACWAKGLGSAAIMACAWAMVVVASAWMAFIRETLVAMVWAVSMKC